MAKTLLQCVNEILKKTGEIHGDTAALTSLTSTARQRSIDIAIQSVNEGIDELYSISNMPRPRQMAEATITLTTGTRNGISLASDMSRLLWPFIDRDNTQYLFEYPTGHRGLLHWDIQQDDEGLPHYGAINPADGTLTLDRAPTSVENGRTYYYQYLKDTGLGVATDEVPFDDDVFRAMVPVWVQLWRAEKGSEFDRALFRTHFGRAARLLLKQVPRDSYHNR